MAPTGVVAEFGCDSVTRRMRGSQQPGERTTNLNNHRDGLEWKCAAQHSGDDHRSVAHSGRVNRQSEILTVDEAESVHVFIGGPELFLAAT